LIPSRKAKKFLAKLISKTYLRPFLNNCVWYAGVSALAKSFTTLDGEMHASYIEIIRLVKPHLSPCLKEGDCCALAFVEIENAMVDYFKGVLQQDYIKIDMIAI